MRVRWCPGHQGVQGNEYADTLAKRSLLLPAPDENCRPTASGVRSLLQNGIKDICTEWWTSQTQSDWYKQWKLSYNVKTPPSLGMPRHLLHRFCAMRHGHGDFADYHERFGRPNLGRCPKRLCRRSLTPRHLVDCPSALLKWKRWPKGPRSYPNPRARLQYLLTSLADPRVWLKYVKLVEPWGSKPALDLIPA